MKLINVNKFFNRKKANEIHVLNNINLEFPNSGFVAIMGQSGSGKTTLLNALCGLDKINSGVIEVGDVEIKKYKSSTWDRLRNQEFGYIFQNYNIFEEKTVFENVALSLEFLGMSDKEEIKRRVMQSLELVGMDKYRNRQAGALSGGEMQRVAIARALVKNPTIMIADEPTGNLDEKNTIMIMNILKKISKERLVILVTHEKEIGEFYADTIIHISDGKITDITNGSNNELKLYSDNTIYLQDLNKDNINTSNINVASYYSSKFDCQVNIDIVLEGNDIIIKASSPDKKIKYASNDSNINIVDGKKPQLTKEEIDKTLSEVTDVEPLDKSKLSCKYNIGLFKHIKKGFERVFDLSKFKKLFLIGFVVSACLLVLSFSAYAGIRHVDDKEFVRYDKTLTQILYKEDANYLEKYNKLNSLISEGKIDYIYPSLSSSTRTVLPTVKYIKFKALNQYTDGATLEGTLIPYNRVNNYKYKIPNKGEIVVDRFLANMLYNISLSSSNTITSDELLMMTEVQIGNKTYKVIDISEENNGCIFVNPADELNLYYSNVFAYSGEKAGLDSIEKGKAVVECMPGGIIVGQTIDFYGTSYEVVATIDSEDNYNLYLNSEDLKYELFKESVSTSNTILIKSNLRPKEIKKLFSSSEVKNVENIYKLGYEDASNEKMGVARILLIFALVTVIAPLIFLFFLMRSNLISRVKEVGVYRALGLSRLSVLKMHASEALAISATGTLVGWIIGVVIIYKVRSGQLAEMVFSGNPILLVLCLLLCVLINLIVGCIPIMVMLGKTPQQILSKYDI